MKTWLQNLIPQRALSRALGMLANARLGGLTTLAIQAFVRKYQVAMNEAEIRDIRQFKTFNDFFTRALKPGLRTLSGDENTIISPVDGCVSELGKIEQDQLLQAKGAYFSLADLCADANIAAYFNNGAFLTAYLAPKDYHRIHMPFTGKLIDMIYVPGNLFSVDPESVRGIPNLFARNERVICVFETSKGMMAVIAVGAMIVGSIATVWHGVVVPQEGRYIKRWNYHDQNITLKRGDELGHFMLGSTVVLLTQENAFSWNRTVMTNSPLKMGEILTHS